MRLSETEFIRKLIQERVEFSDLKRKPSVRLIIAIALVALSYATCWPVIALLGVVAVKIHAPQVFSIGSPTAYVFSHMLFFAGMLVAGSEGAAYVKTFIRWLLAAVFESSIGRYRTQHYPFQSDRHF